jgi:hypothetical protein
MTRGAVATTATLPEDPDAGTLCSTDSDCTEGKNGRCVFYSTPPPSSEHGTECSYDRCFSDSNCAVGSVCGCRASATDTGANTCLAGNCLVDSDCRPSGYCSPSASDCDPSKTIVGYFCHTAHDECTNDSDCPASPASNVLGAYCRFDSSVGHWVCDANTCQH